MENNKGLVIGAFVLGGLGVLTGIIVAGNECLKLIRKNRKNKSLTIQVSQPSVDTHKEES